ncbi:secreted from muscle stage larvae 1 [Trichuris trichiura]|uniref:Secreted from muscle stage larvae 1 n=1 Tax=Trichuris trichiura TaxID=36087 RepID=A0A077ZA99_TRITR|nr:secreted from muscle stage larvae 1 [Trichuris trichiura]
MMPLLHASVLILSAYLATADFDCKEELGVYFQCFSSHVKNFLSNNSDWEEKKAEALKCFVTSGCQEPTLNYSEDMSKLSGMNMSETYFKCVGNTIKDMVSMAEKCIAAEMPGFQFGKLPHNGDADSNASDYTYVIMKISTSADDPNMCPGDSQKKVRACLQQVADGTRHQRQGHLKEICAKRRQCFSKISDHCKEQFHKTKQLLKKCSCDDVNIDIHKANMVKCLSDDVDEEKEQKAMERILHKVHDCDKV